MKAVVESVSKQSIIVTNVLGTHTLSGAAVEAIAPTLKLGDNVEFDDPKKLTTIKKIKETKASTVVPVQGRSPEAKMPQKHTW